MTEAELLEAIRQAAALGGWLVYHTHDSRHSAAGFPDLVLVRDRVVIFAELKSSNGQVSDAQSTWIEALTRAGQRVQVWRPEHLDATLRMLTSRRSA